MGADVVRLGWRRVVHVAANVAVVVLARDLRYGYPARGPRNVSRLPTGVDDFRYVFWSQEVLGFAFPVLAIGVNKQHVFAGSSVLFVNHQHAGGNTGSVEETGW